VNPVILQSSDNDDTVQREFAHSRDTLVQYAFSFLRDDAAAQDVVQDAFMRLWRHRTAVATGAPLRAWLFTAVRNLCLNQLRDERTRALIQSDVAVATAIAPRALARPDQQVETREVRETLHRAIAELPARQREALLLSRFNGLTHAEVAQAMGCTARTVNNQLVRALDRLRISLGRTGMAGARASTA
jgi:RNA polymerase sigma-70 factor, ECF subfamily